ncbi:response regulator [Microvirga arabica]|uniref:Response regulator n=1 Tax=Microvirga arabica TaxID=1128671 RepID=A0ABV6Y375_9HYPH
MVILVVEDEPLVRIFIADFMDEAGFKVLEAVDADEALTILKARPDVQAIISDVEMPRGSMNGFALARAVREQWPGIGIVMTSGRERPGPDELPDEVVFLAKPYLPDTVIQVIRQMATPQVIEPQVAQSA